MILKNFIKTSLIETITNFVSYDLNVLTATPRSGNVEEIVKVINESRLHAIDKLNEFIVENVANSQYKLRNDVPTLDTLRYEFDDSASVMTHITKQAQELSADFVSMNFNVDQQAFQLSNTSVLGMLYDGLGTVVEEMLDLATNYTTSFERYSRHLNKLDQTSDIFFISYAVLTELAGLFQTPLSTVYYNIQEFINEVNVVGNPNFKPQWIDSDSDFIPLYVTLFLLILINLNNSSEVTVEDIESFYNDEN